MDKIRVKYNTIFIPLLVVDTKCENLTPAW